MKGIGILAVIAGHTTTDTIAWKLIYSFHMPMFFILAGYFFKPNCNLKKKLNNDFHRLLIPYFVTIFIWGTLLFLYGNKSISTYEYLLKATFFASGYTHTSPFFATAPRISVLWFLVALFWCRTIYNYISCKTQHKFVIAGIIAIIATITDRYIINLPLGLLTGMSAMMFYLIGDILHNNLPDRNTSRWFIIICATCWIIHLFFSKIEMCIYYYRIYPIDILGTTFGSIAIYYISKGICHHAMRMGGTFLATIGQISLTILCVHCLEKDLIDYDITPLNNNWFLLFLTKSIICLGMAFFWQKSKTLVINVIYAPNKHIL